LSGIIPRPQALTVESRLPESEATLCTTRLQPDELTALCQFMAGAVELSEPMTLVRKALQVVMAQTGGGIAGFLNVDPGDPLPKLVIPESATVDVQLSRQLTRRVQRDNKTIWLRADLADTATSESLLQLNDALCVPLKVAGVTTGALHVYRTEAYFTERDLLFCEALAGYLAGQLHAIKVRRTLEAENSRLRNRMPGTDDLVGDSPPMQRLRDEITRAAAQPFTVLIRGESGSGKELVALALHKQSQRGEGPLVVVNCAAIAPSLLEAELFGFLKGAFSGADRNHPGYFQQADEGTLFLDEVGELSADCQAKLLRVLDGRGFRPVGAVNEVRTDVRVVAATHRDLEAEVVAGRFRQDLLYRLQVIQIRMPPLREHPEDISFLVQYFLDRLASDCRRQVKVTPAAMARLKTFSWPGNVRQLRTVLEASVVMCPNDIIDVDDLRLIGPGTEPTTPTSGTPLANVPQSLALEDVEFWAIERVMKETNQNVTQAAKILGINRDTLTNKLRKRSRSES
jgi:Nif-specific regulatory protein